MRQPALNIQKLTKIFTDRRPFYLGLWGKETRRVIAVKDLDLNVDKGEIFGIVGPNGSGKSTLVRLIATLLVPDSGVIEVFGKNVQKEEFEVKKLINRVSVEASFFKKLSPLENLLYAARLYGMRGKVIHQQSRQILNKLDIEDHRIYQPMEKMSRGMQQKVAIARGFLTSPILLLLDEPTTGLDPRSKREVQKFILDIRNHHDSTILLTTHDMEEADRVCDRVAIIDRGKIIAKDTPEGLKRMIPRVNGNQATLEEVFIELTGKTLEGREEEIKNKR